MNSFLYKSIRKKTIVCVLLCIIFLISMISIGCNVTNPANFVQADDDKVNIIATIFAPFDFARAVAGDKANITMLLPPAAESHSFEPTPQDIIKIENCDVFIFVGGDSDTWVKEVLATIDNDRMQVVTLMDCVATVTEEVKEGMSDHIEEQHAHHELDEHVWTSPKNAKQIVQKIADAIIAADPANKSYYQANTQTYLEKLDELDVAFQEVVDAGVRRTLIFGDRFPFRYFVDAYHLDYYAAFSGCSAEAQPSAATIAFLIDKVKTEGIPVVFHEELSNRQIANAIGEATGAKVRELHACHNITKDDFENGVTYLELMTRNVAALKEALH